MSMQVADLATLIGVQLKLPEAAAPQSTPAVKAGHKHDTLAVVLDAYMSSAHISVSIHDHVT